MNRIKECVIWGPLAVAAVLALPILVLCWVIRVHAIESRQRKAAMHAASRRRGAHYRIYVRRTPAAARALRAAGAILLPVALAALLAAAVYDWTSDSGPYWITGVGTLAVFTLAAFTPFVLARIVEIAARLRSMGRTGPGIYLHRR
jgi:hypothetical protein